MKTLRVLTGGTVVGVMLAVVLLTAAVAATSASAALPEFKKNVPQTGTYHPIMFQFELPGLGGIFDCERASNGEAVVTPKSIEFSKAGQKFKTCGQWCGAATISPLTATPVYVPAYGGKRELKVLLTPPKEQLFGTVNCGTWSQTWEIRGTLLAGISPRNRPTHTIELKDSWGPTEYSLEPTGPLLKIAPIEVRRQLGWSWEAAERVNLNGELSLAKEVELVG